ncbi:MAG TPA: LPS export ABC transporter permease LptF [Hyphomicrobiaceae bacterium]|nr:LPS export ABC transporter permease LptF [Hyphomicrobiaceae bacterium]
MPSLLSRYIFRQAAGTVLLILLSLSGVVWIALALRQLNLVTTQGQDTLMFLKMTLLALPNLMALIAPIALLVATIHVLNRLNGDSELIIATAAGGTIWNIARPLLVLALLVAVAVAAVNHFAQPWSLQLVREYIIQIRTDLINQVIQPGRFTPPEPGVMFHIRDRTLDGELQGILVHDARNDKEVTTYLADRGRIIKQPGGAYLLMQKGHILKREKLDEPVRIIEFENAPIDLARFEQKGEVIELKPRERYFSELVRPDPKDPIFLRQPGLLRAELHERFASLLYPFAFVLIAVAFVGQAQTTRQNRMEAIIVAFVIAAACRLGGLAATNVVALRASALPLLYGIPIAAIFAGAIAAHLRMRARRQSRLRAMIDNAVDALLARLPRFGRKPAQKGAAS